jgi:sugar lactone lactonase YvrE
MQRFHRSPFWFLFMIGFTLLLAGCDLDETPQMPGNEILTTETEPAPQETTPVDNAETEESEKSEGSIERPGHVWTTSGLETSYLYRSFLQIPVGLALGPDGHLYIGDWTGHHVVKVSPDGTMEDLGLWKTVEALRFDGPRGIAFDSAGNLYINNHSAVFRISSAGNVKELAGIQGSPVGSIAISNSDELYYTDRSEQGRLLKWEQVGTSTVILDGIPFAENLVFGHDGTLYLTQMGRPDLLKVNLDTGTYEVFAKDVCRFDPCYLAVDQEGDIWIRAIWDLHQFSSDGEEKTFVIDGETQSDDSNRVGFHTSAGIAFDDQGGLYIASYNSKLLYLAPESANTLDSSFSLEMIVPGFEASDLAISSTGIVYGTDLNLGQVLAFPQDGSSEVIFDHGQGGRAAVAVDPTNRLFIGMPDGEILRVEDDGSVSHYADLHAQRMVFGSDGILYAAVVLDGIGQVIVGITGVDEYSILAAELDSQPLAGGIHISPAQEDGLYVISEIDRLLYLIDFEGDSQFIADLKSLGGGGPAVMAANPVTGDIFWIPHGPYELYKITPTGETSKVAVGLFGDPWGMVVSPDGKFVYVAESGAIDRIPLSD